MLVQLTNNCNELCEHCLQCSQNKEIQHMSPNTFIRTVEFSNALNARVLTLSGGEPTLNPEWYSFCKKLNYNYKKPFTLVTNGTWIDDEDIVQKIVRVLNFQYCLGVQVTTVKEYYPSYKKIVANKEKFKELGKNLYLEIDPTIYMEDLGRAKTSVKAQEQIDKNPYHMSCLNACLVFKQVKSLKEVGTTLESIRQFCKPSVDWQGGIHLSESWLCPSIGNVNEDTKNMIWKKGRAFKPCLRCKNSLKFMNSNRPDIVKAREIILNN